jgi:hypothetical protein
MRQTGGAMRSHGWFRNTATLTDELSIRADIKTASPKGGHQDPLVAINDHLVAVSVTVMVAILLDNDRVPIPMLISFTDDGAIPISVAIPIMPSADRYTNRPDTNSDFFGARRHCCADARYGGNHQCVFHCLLLYCETMDKQRDHGR